MFPAQFSSRANDLQRCAERGKLIKVRLSFVDRWGPTRGEALRF